MDKQKVIEYFGSPERTAYMLGITRQAVVMWPDPIPQGRAYQVEVFSKGKLKVDPEAYK